MTPIELALVAGTSAIGGFIGAAGGRTASFIVQTSIRFGWNGVRHLTTRLGGARQKGKAK